MIDVRIVTVDRGYSLKKWLCPDCTDAWEAAGWDVTKVEAPPHALKCEGPPKGNCKGEA